MIAAVVVTYNRLALLQECVAALRAQTRQPDEIIVVNNSSNDGTAEWLADQEGLTVITQENSGSAGGQYTGIRTAYRNGHDWFWCMDDDTIPRPTALAALVESRPFRESTTGFLCSMTLDANGAVDDVLPTTHSKDWWGTISQDQCLRVDHSTFVSVMVSRHAVKTVGLPLRWMFIWGEDVEFTKRIAGRFKGWAVLDSVVVHKYVSKSYTGDAFDDPKSRARLLYFIRNELIRVRVDPTIGGRSGRFFQLVSCLYFYLRLIVRRKMPVRTLAWIWEGLVREVRYDFPD